MTTMTSYSHGVPSWIDLAALVDPHGAAFPIMAPAS